MIVLLHSSTMQGETFWSVNSADGLANDQVNCVAQDAEGFLWIGTGNGLSRFDGLRFKNFYPDFRNIHTIPSGMVEQIVPTLGGWMWLRTSSGYCLLNTSTETVNRDVSGWMRSHGMIGVPDYVATDNLKNTWVAVQGVGVYCVPASGGKPVLLSSVLRGGKMPRGRVTDHNLQGHFLLLAYHTGQLVLIDTWTRQMVWMSRSAMRMTGAIGYDKYCTVMDSRGACYLLGNRVNMIFDRTQGRVFTSFRDYLSSLGIPFRGGALNVKDANVDKQGNLWLATHGDGLVVIDFHHRLVRNMRHDGSTSRSLPDNNLRSISFDLYGGAWVGTPRSGLAYLSQVTRQFPLVHLDDVTAISQTRDGTVWLGTMGQGLYTLSLKGNMPSVTPQPALTMGMETQVVTSTVAAPDGTLWVGLLDCGLMAVRNGQRMAIYRLSSKGLASDQISSLAADARGNIYIGTRDAGLQVLQSNTGKFVTYNKRNGRLPSNFVSSVSLTRNGGVVVAHSQGISFLSVDKRKWHHFTETRTGAHWASYAMSQVMEDSRGLIWVTNMSGVDVLDLQTDSLYHLVDVPKVAVSLSEDKFHQVWAAVDYGMVRYKVQHTSTGWAFLPSRYDAVDGLQRRQLHPRSICVLRSGVLLVGGPDGINMIHPGRGENPTNSERVLFSGLVLFDKPLRVGEHYGDEFELLSTLNSTRTLTLNHAVNTFTILLASDRIRLPQRTTYLYYLRGLSNQWLSTSAGQPSITYTNLSPGDYTLLVCAVGHDGSVGPTRELHIVIKPPFYRSWIALLLYLVVIVFIFYGVYRFLRQRQHTRDELERMRLEAAHAKEMERVKLQFITDVGHELRTPLALIVSPLKRLIRGEETLAESKATLMLILRNATRLLNLVNQALDMRRMDIYGEALHLVSGDVIELARKVVANFMLLKEAHVTLFFEALPEHLMMTVDDDKLEKILNNLLSNAYKFAPPSGKVSLHVMLCTSDGNAVMVDGSHHWTPEECVEKGLWLKMEVSNTGKCISDEDKENLFDRYYQAKNRQHTYYASTGLGLSLVKAYTEQMGGNVCVSDLEGGGAVFTVMLPFCWDASAPSMQITEHLEDMNVEWTELSSENHKTLQQTVNATLGKGRYEVLLVDDSHDFRGFMSEELSQYFRVRTAANGVEALQVLEDHLPDAILCDVMMPEMDGNELCKVLKSREDTRQIPFVMLTARLSNDYRVEGLTNGADDYITKPFDIDLLCLRLTRLIGLRGEGATLAQQPVDTDLGGKAVQRLTPDGVDAQPEEQTLNVNSTPTISAADKMLVSHATAYVEKHIESTDLSVEAMSEELGMSRVHLYKKLVSLTGSTPSEFIRNIKMHRAAELLREGTLNVSEVAYKVGFNSPRYFSKYFKETFGVMPSQFRKGEDGEE